MNPLIDKVWRYNEATEELQMVNNGKVEVSITRELLNDPAAMRMFWHNYLDTLSQSERDHEVRGQEMICEVCAAPATITVKYPTLPEPVKLRLASENEDLLHERRIVIPITDAVTGEKYEIVHYTSAPEFGVIVKHFCAAHNPLR